MENSWTDKHIGTVLPPHKLIRAYLFIFFIFFFSFQPRSYDSSILYIQKKKFMFFPIFIRPSAVVAVANFSV